MMAAMVLEVKFVERFVGSAPFLHEAWNYNTACPVLDVQLTLELDVMRLRGFSPRKRLRNYVHVNTDLAEIHQHHDVYHREG